MITGLGDGVTQIPTLFYGSLTLRAVIYINQLFSIDHIFLILITDTRIFLLQYGTKSKKNGELCHNTSAIKTRILTGPTQSADVTNKIIHVECLSQCLAYNNTSKNGAFYN